MVLQVLVDLADWEMAETLPPVTYVAQDRLTAPVRSDAVALTSSLAERQVFALLVQPG